MTANDIKVKRFSAARNGYDPDEVNSFLDEIAKEFEELEKAHETSEGKIATLVEKINQYREDEDAIKNAMIMAQKEASKTVNEAKAQARDMIESAKSEQVRLSEQSAAECERIIREHKEKCARLIQENTEVTEKKITAIRESYDEELAKFEEMKKEVTLFKATLVDLYNKQLHLIMEIPQFESEEDTASDEAEEPAAEEVQQETEEEASEEQEETREERIQKALNTGSFEPVIPKENLNDLQFGKNN